MSPRDQSVSIESRACLACKENAAGTRYPHLGCEFHRHHACQDEAQIFYLSLLGLQRRDADLMDSLLTTSDGFSVVRSCELYCLDVDLSVMHLEG